MSKARAKGTAWETAVCEYLRERGFIHVERRAQGGSNDRGDIAGLPGVVLECKAVQRIDLSIIMRELEVEMDNDGADLGAAIIKRRSRSVEDAYAVMPLSVLADLLRDALT